MISRWFLILAVTLPACSKLQSGQAESDDALEPGETKLTLDQTPAPVRAAIQRELSAGAKLHDISQKQQGGKTVYETDLLRDGNEWELLLSDTGQILHNIQDEPEAQKAADREDDDDDDNDSTSSAYRDTFPVDRSKLSPTGNNPYLTLQPGRVLKLSNGKDTLTITVLPKTKTVDGVETAILEERETKNGQLAEISYNYFATDPATNDVYYFGEDVDNYKDGKVLNHDSAWLAGRDGARFGLMVPGKPAKGTRYYQEYAPKVALDRAEIVSTDETVKTPAGTFHCLHLRETTPLEPDVSHKYFAPGIGVIKDDDFELTEKP